MRTEDFVAGHLRKSLHPCEFDIDICISEEKSDKYFVDATTGVNVEAEPVLVVACVVHKESSNVPKTLRYGLTRTAYGTELKSIDEAKPMLAKLALPLLENDLKNMEAGGGPESATKVLMLNW
jgi:hypothetical protein